MSVVSIKIKVINQLTDVIEIDNGDGITIRDYNADVMVANAEAMADMMPDCQVSMSASNGDCIYIPSRNMMKDEKELSYEAYTAKWYPGLASAIEKLEEQDWAERDSICF